VGALVMTKRLCEHKKKKKNRPKNLVIFWRKNYNCDFSVLRIISQQKVLVGALLMT
jgi:hypothetical protein